jgi:DNA-binding response OmpR family regulator
MKKLLIVEDDQIVANIYRNKFSVDGFQVEVASDGIVGMELLQSFRPDAVVMDLMLPNMTGVELMKSIRAHSDFRELPVIVFSNTYLTNMVQEAWKAGATKCLSKANCTPKQVIEVVRNAISTTNGKSATVGAKDQNHSPGHHTTHTPRASASIEISDAAFQAELFQSFVDSLPSILGALRSSMQAMIKAESEDARVEQAQELYRRVHAITGNAALAGVAHIAQLCDALEVLLKELHEKPKTLTPSTLRTVASTIDFLAILFQKQNLAATKEFPPANILVVDDEAISRRAVTYALEKAKLKSVSVEDPAAAMDLLSETKFDLVFLDVDMPGMNGFELCTKLRNMPAHKKTPVIFVTSLNDFESRANSTMSGGNDFIAKPFLFIELAVKALVYILRARLDKDIKLAPVR